MIRKLDDFLHKVLHKAFLKTLVIGRTHHLWIVPERCTEEMKMRQMYGRRQVRVVRLLTVPVMLAAELTNLIYPKPVKTAA